MASSRSKKVPHPRIASAQVWRKERVKLLAAEKAATKHQDRVAAARRRLPMVKIDKGYTFAGPGGKRTLLDLFEGRRQLVVYHFMFGPDWEKGCPGCTGYVDAIGDLSMLHKRNTTFALVSRAPLPKLRAYQKKHGWTLPWYSSFGSDFNYDFHATLDEAVAPLEYNFRTKAQMEARDDVAPPGERHGLSVFFQMNGEVFHAYSAYARGTENLVNSYSILDVTPYGRQEDWEDSPRGWPQKPTYG